MLVIVIYFDLSHAVNLWTIFVFNKINRISWNKGRHTLYLVKLKVRILVWDIIHILTDDNDFRIKIKGFDGYSFQLFHKENVRNFKNLS